MASRLAIDIAMDMQKGNCAGSLLSVGPLPEGIKDLLRIVAEGEWRSAGTEHVYARHRPEVVRAASAAYLALILFDRKLDPYRTLGLQPGARPEDVRENKRLLLKWLHPDRNPDARERTYLGRVIEAAEAIEAARAAPAAAIEGKPPQIVVRARPPRPTRAPRGGAARLVISHLASGVMHLGRSMAIVAATTVAALLTWRIYMDEPIGASLERYAKLTLGMLKW